MKRVVCMCLVALVCCARVVAHCGQCKEDTCEYCEFLLSGKSEAKNIVPTCECKRGKCTCNDARHNTCPCIIIDKCKCAEKVEEQVTKEEAKQPEKIEKETISENAATEAEPKVVNKVTFMKPGTRVILTPSATSQTESVKPVGMNGAAGSPAIVESQVKEEKPVVQVQQPEKIKEVAVEPAPEEVQPVQVQQIATEKQEMEEKAPAQTHKYHKKAIHARHYKKSPVCRRAKKGCPCE